MCQPFLSDLIQNIQTFGPLLFNIKQETHSRYILT